MVAFTVGLLKIVIYPTYNADRIFKISFQDKQMLLLSLLSIQPSHCGLSEVCCRLFQSSNQLIILKSKQQMPICSLPALWQTSAVGLNN